MTALLMPSSVSTPPPKFVPKPIRWTCQQFQDMSDSGVLEGRTVILVDGEILDMPTPNPPHNAVVGIVDYTLKQVFSTGYWVRIQSGLPTTLDTDPIPDLALVVGSPRDFLTHHPPTALLVVEVSDSSLSYDIGEKSNLYAAAGIADYWVVDVKEPRLYVFRDPVADPSAPRSFRYSTVQTLKRGDSITPLAGAASIAVADLLP